LLTDLERKLELKRISEAVVHKYVNFSFNEKPTMRSGDNVLNYSSYLLSVVCLYLAYKDSIKEGDGLRVLRCWRYLLPFFINSGWKNYSIEALNLLHQYHFSLPPLQAQQPIWSRFINTQGVKGRNIPVDLHQEHLNKVIKDMVNDLSAN
jgi:hypothetical protein